MSEVSTTQCQTPTKKEEEQPENVGAAIGKALEVWRLWQGKEERRAGTTCSDIADFNKFRRKSECHSDDNDD